MCFYITASSNRYGASEGVSMIKSDVPAVLTMKEIANLLHTSRSTVKRWIDAGLLPASRVGKVIRIEGKDLVIFFNHYKKPRLPVPW